MTIVVLERSLLVQALRVLVLILMLIHLRISCLLCSLLVQALQVLIPVQTFLLLLCLRPFDTVLNNVRKYNVNNIIIACLNINSLANKFDQLTTVINDNIDILVLVETKLDDTFPESQFFINGFSKPYRIDRNRNGGGVMIYVRQDIPSKRLSKHNLPSDIECLCVEINLRKSKWLLCGTYHIHLVRWTSIMSILYCYISGYWICGSLDEKHLLCFYR